jgi:hypothetical protein
MRVGISLTSNHPDATDPRQAACWMVERAAAARRAALDSLFVGDQHVSPTPIIRTRRELRTGNVAYFPSGCIHTVVSKVGHTAIAFATGEVETME